MNTPTPSSFDDEALPAPLRDRMAAHGNLRSYPAHSILINEGDVADTMYIVLAGRVKLYASADNGREIVLTELTPGHYFGELAVEGAPRSLSAVALEPTRCCLVPGAQLRALLAAEPDFALHLTHKLMRMVRRLTEQVKSLALQDVYARVVGLLMEQSDAEPGAETRVLRHKLTQQDIADRVGSSREMVNRVMKELAAGGYVTPDPAHQRLVIRRKLPAAW